MEISIWKSRDLSFETMLLNERDNGNETDVSVKICDANDSRLSTKPNKMGNCLNPLVRMRKVKSHGRYARHM